MSISSFLKSAYIDHLRGADGRRAGFLRCPRLLAVVDTDEARVVLAQMNDALHRGYPRVPSAGYCSTISGLAMPIPQPSMTRIASSSLANTLRTAPDSSFSSDDDVAITAAPAIFAICSAAMETPPVPSTKTLSPVLICPSPTRARQAVTPAVVTVAASAWLQSRGAWVKAVAARTERWAAKPSMPSPGVPARLPTGLLGSPSCH